MTADRPLPDGDPLRVLVLESLGWLIVGIASVATGAFLISTFRLGSGAWLLVVLAAGAGYVGIAIGLVLIVIASSGRRGRSQGRWTLWAKLLMIVGSVFSISLPILFVGSFMADWGGAWYQDRSTVVQLLAAGGIPFLIGMGLIIPAVIWGRHKRPPSIPDIFS